MYFNDWNNGESSVRLEELHPLQSSALTVLASLISSKFSLSLTNNSDSSRYIVDFIQDIVKAANTNITKTNSFIDLEINLFDLVEN